MKPLKIILAAVIGLPLLLIAIVAVLLLTVDKAPLVDFVEEKLAEKGAHVELSHDIGWTIYPNIGFSLGEASLFDVPEKQGNPLAKIDSAEVSVAFKPLFQGNVEINGIYLEGAQLNYLIDKKGKSNWDKLIENFSSSEPEPQDSPSEEGQAIALEVKTIALKNIGLVMKDATQDSSIVLEKINLTASDVDLSGNTFPLSLTAYVKEGPVSQVNVDHSSRIAFNLAEKNLGLKQAKTTLTFSKNQSKLTMDNDLSVNFADDLSVAGNLGVKTSELRQLLSALDIDLSTFPQDRIRSFSLKNNFSFKNGNVAAKDIAVQFDDTTVTGNASVKTGDRLDIALKLAADKFNLDQYFPPSEETEAPAASTPAAEDTPLPFELLRSLDLNTEITLAQLIASNIPVTNIDVLIQNKRGYLDIKRLNANLDQGAINMKGALNAKSSTAKLKLNAKVSQIDMGKLLKQVAETDMVTGNINGTMQAISRGKTVQDLQKNLTVDLNAESEKMRFNPVNITQQFCKAVSLIQKSEPNAHNWTQYSELEPIKMVFRYEKEVLNINSLSASIEQLTAGAKGYFDVKQGKFDVPIDLSLANFASSLEGCDLVDAKWRNRMIPLRCKGSLENLGAKTCLPDTKRLADAAKDELKRKAKEKAEAEKKRAAKKIEGKAKEVLKEKLGEEKVDELKKSLKGLFGR